MARRPEVFVRALSMEAWPVQRGDRRGNPPILPDEAEFAALRYFALNGTDHSSHTEQGAAIAAYIRWRNARTLPKTGFATDSPDPNLDALPHQGCATSH